MQRPEPGFVVRQPFSAAAGIPQEIERREKLDRAECQRQATHQDEATDQTSIRPRQRSTKSSASIKGVGRRKPERGEQSERLGGKELEGEDHRQENPGTVGTGLRSAVRQEQGPWNPCRAGGVVVKIPQRHHGPAKDENEGGKKCRRTALPPAASQSLRPNRRQREVN